MRDRILLALDGEADEPDAVALTEPAAGPPGETEAEAEPAVRTEPAPRTRPSRPANREQAGATRPGERRGRRKGALAGARGRLAVASVALLALVGSLTGMSVLLSRDALPGDALYGVKRTAEAASLGLTFGEEPKALKHLEFAAARITEIETLARRYPDPADAPVGGYLTALTDFDNDAITGTRQLIVLATSTDGRLLDSLRDWSTQQAARLRGVATHLPEDVRNRSTATRALLDRITARAQALRPRMECVQVTSGSSDDIGPLPATSACREDPAAATGLPSVPVTPDNSVPPTSGAAETPSAPLPPAQPTPDVPLVPVPGATVSVPGPTERPTTPDTSTPPSTPPLIELPPLLPGLPPLRIG
ncbi:DUF5667 domain-containing protein [Actinophytocola oryzae]|uniref:DUF5667 domain-containing protein n=1 Tax=Actinophytocola oryzae TaxID=502181 RepID=A0A4R7VCY3_9PSEU|nr:DUF5667 domain-containing protein [Actinophytocola oryzae]TDV46972.1 hypothetical protein CLV71_110155 [Actinophytocola oryzae]